MTAPSPASRIRGCLLGGAVGDALGAPIEFDSLQRIREEHGPDGVTGFLPAYGRSGGAITDDTQMTLWTAEGLLRTEARFSEKGIAHPPSMLHRSYLRWLHTQGYPWDEVSDWGEPDGWLIQSPVLNTRRAPGNTCLSALQSGQMGTPAQKINDSKGCGGVMRVAPIGLVAEDPFKLGMAAAAITHTHPSGYLAAGTFAHIIAGLYRGADLPSAIDEALQILAGWPGHEETSDAIRAAVAKAGDGPATPEQVERLGEGWVAEEALAISLYCALTATDFRSGVLTAVNHGGDSDSTGAITGNLLGTMWEARLPQNGGTGRLPHRPDTGTGRPGDVLLRPCGGRRHRHPHHPGRAGPSRRAAPPQIRRGDGPGGKTPAAARDGHPHE